MIIEPGTRVYIRKAFSRKRETGVYTVIQVTNSCISFRKDTGYAESITLLDLRQRCYILELEDGTEVKFKPLPDTIKIQREKLGREMEVYRNTIKTRRRKKPEESEVKKNMGRGKTLNIDIEKVIEICKVHGTKTDGARAIAAEFGITLVQAKNFITHRHIKEILENKMSEKEQAQKAAAESVKEAVQEERIQEHTAKIDNEVTITNDDVERLTVIAEQILGDKIPEIKAAPDLVNHPSHYTAGSIEVIDYIQDKLPPEMFEGFCVGVILQYLSRYQLKGGLEDLKKARWYLDKIIGVMDRSSEFRTTV